MVKRFNFLSILIVIIFSAYGSEIYADNTSSDEYIILNLHWSDGEITLNSLNKVRGLKNRTGRASSVQAFFYMLLTENGETIKSEYFRVPRKLHYDYFDESTGELKGGQIKRDNFDFVIKVPSYYNAKEIKFYKAAGDLASNHLKSKQGFAESFNSECLGEINF